jgi:glycosyltransferase involved in cell wall biosynthesis
VSPRLTIARRGVDQPPATAGEELVRVEDVRRWLTSCRAITRVGRYHEARILVHRLESAGRPLPLALALRAMSRGPVYLEDECGRRQPISVRQLVTWTAHFVSEPLKKSALLRHVEQTISEIDAAPVSRTPPLDLTRSPLYLRTDLSFGIRAGGSVGHIAGVLNALGHFTGRPIFLTTDDVPTVRADIETHAIAPSEAFWNFRELPTFVLNGVVERTADRALAGRPIAFVYQRYSVNNYAGARIARRARVPLVIEYNGSEIWMSRHWGRPLTYEPLSERIERLNLRAADLIVVVSDAMADELSARGIDRERVLVNFNGVDERRYRPDVDGSAVRRRYTLDERTVIGFIGTFGPWHGATVLARAYALLCRDPAFRSSTRLLMIGDGIERAEAQRLLRDAQLDEQVVFTGLVPQTDGPAHLAACDILVSPHVPNRDGSPFFGSPTKLFEYMAMGKGIVASRLEQIGEVLTHDETAWLVAPGDPDDLAHGLARLVADPDRRTRLGRAARQAAVERHTWRQHTRRTIERLRHIAGLDASQR